METIISCIITGIFSVLVVVIPIVINNKRVINESMKCSLRNDILSIYDSCKKDKQITLYQLQALEYSYEQYKALKGNSFVDDIMNIVKMFEVID